MHIGQWVIGGGGLAAVLTGLSYFKDSLSGSFTLTASLAGSPLNGQVVHAAGGAFYLGLEEPVTFCPFPTDRERKNNCPKVTGTVFRESSYLSLDVCSFSSPIHLVFGVSKPM